MYCHHDKKCTLTGLVFCVEEQIRTYKELRYLEDEGVTEREKLICEIEFNKES